MTGERLRYVLDDLDWLARNEAPVKAIDAAKVFLSRIGATAPEPDFSARQLNNVVLTWYGGSRRVNVTFYEDGEATVERFDETDLETTDLPKLFGWLGGSEDVLI